MISIVFQVTKWLASSVCIFYAYKEKSDNLKNEQGDTYTNKQSERPLIYPRFLLHDVDLRVLLGRSLQRVRCIVGKNHNHLKHTEGLFYLDGKKLNDIDDLEQPPLYSGNSRQRQVNQRQTNTAYWAALLLQKITNLIRAALLISVFVWHLCFFDVC